jgi:hypothetical protein
MKVVIFKIKLPQFRIIAAACRIVDLLTVARKDARRATPGVADIYNCLFSLRREKEIALDSIKPIQDYFLFA